MSALDTLTKLLGPGGLARLRRTAGAYRPPVPESRPAFRIAGIAGGTVVNGEAFGLFLIEPDHLTFIEYLVEFRTDGAWTARVPPLYAVHVAFVGTEDAAAMAALIAAALPGSNFDATVANGVVTASTRDSSVADLVAIGASQHWSPALGTLLPYQAGGLRPGRFGYYRAPVLAGSPRGVEALIPKPLEPPAGPR